MFRKTVIVFSLACCMATSALAANGMRSINGVPLSVNGAQGGQETLLSPSLIDQARNVNTLGDALRILGPAYIAPDDSLHIAHWHFQNGAMVTLWPQGGEALADAVSLRPRPDCGVPASECKDMILQRNGKTASRSPQGQQQNTNLNNYAPLMNQVAAQHGVSPTNRVIGGTLLRLVPGR